MSLSIILLNWNNAPDTIRCVQAIAAWQRLRPAIWVVDNGSSDDSVAQLRQNCPNVWLLLSERNLGFAAGNNLAIRHALAAGQTSCFLLLNNDAVIDEAGTLQLLEVLERTRAGVVGPILRDPPPIMGLQAAGGLNPAWRVDTHLRSIPDTSLPYPVDYVPGTAIMIEAKLFEEVGLLDEDYFISGEIADFCRRARCHGYQPLIAPTVTVYHNTGRSSELREAFYAYYFLRNRFLYVRKFYSLATIPLSLYWAIFGLISVAGTFLRGRQSRTRALWLALRHGLSGTFGDQSRLVLAREQQS